MGKYDDAMYLFLTDNRRFADLFNGTVFFGEEVLHADALENSSERYVLDKPKTENRYRDIKKCLKGGAGFCVMAIENQGSIDYSMPWRIMQYDSLEYETQLRELEKRRQYGLGEGNASAQETKFSKEDRLYPVYTICFYHGTKPWDGPKSLKEMMDFRGNEKIKKMFHDYQMTLICVEDLEDMSVFRTDLRLLLEALNARGDKQAMKALMDKKEFEDISVETARTIAIMTDSQRILKKLQKYEDKEEINMCRAWDEIEQEWEDKIAVAEEKANQAEKRLIETVIFDNLEEGKSEETIVAKLVRFFAMEPQEAEQCVRACELTM